METFGAAKLMTEKSLVGQSLAGVRFKSLLSIDPDSNSAFALCGAPGDAGPESTPVVILLRKQPFTEHDVSAIIEGSCIALEQVQHNDEYTECATFWAAERDH